MYRRGDDSPELREKIDRATARDHGAHEKSAQDARIKETPGFKGFL
jgi:hypothetical protein